MANEIIDLIRRFEPILYLHPDEKFVPCDAKRYLEHCALWRLQVPADGKDSIGDKAATFPRSPLVAHGHIVGRIAEIGPADKFLGAVVNGEQPFLVHERVGEQRFLELAGWKDDPGVTSSSQNRYANLDEIKRLYTTAAEPDLRNSRFWYHAEFFDTARLRQLLVDDTTHTAPAFSELFSDLEPRNPALLCYYFFFPGHEEALSGDCANAGESAEAFGSFAGEWTCMTLLLGREKPTDAYQPSWIGVTGRYDRKQTSYNFSNQALTVRRWGINTSGEPFLPHLVDDHPKLFVAQGTHSFYLQPGTYTGDFYKPDGHPLNCGQYDGPSDFTPRVVPGANGTFPIVTSKMVIGSLFGATIGLGVGGLLAGVVWSLLESDNFSTDTAIERVPEAKGETPDITQGNLATVIYPKSFTFPPPDAGDEAHPWAADENVMINGFRYDFVVNRDMQVWWPSYNETAGFRGGWGPFVTDDPQKRRSGMMFPQFWKLFFIGVLKELSRNTS